MGLFSWITQDTGRSIPSEYSNRPTFPVTMTDNEGRQWVEENYEGYGEFGGKDYYELVAEMNGEATGHLDTDRGIGIHLELGVSSIRNKKTQEVYRGRGYDFFNWDSDILPNGSSANALVATGEWEQITIFKENVLLPNLTENPKHKWIDEGPEGCPDQGYFYSDEEDEDDY